MTENGTYLRKKVQIWWVKNDTAAHSNVAEEEISKQFPTEREWVYNFANASMTENGTYLRKKVQIWWVKNDTAAHSNVNGGGNCEAFSDGAGVSL
jgi:hypothetical protein